MAVQRHQLGLLEVISVDPRDAAEPQCLSFPHCAQECVAEMAGDFYDRFGGAIENAIRAVIHRCRIPAAEAPDFSEDCRLYVLERAKSILRGFRAEAKLDTFFFRIFRNLYMDERREVAGRWRASAAARRIGPLAIQFERLVSAKGYTVTAALDAQRAAGATRATIAGLEELSAVLACRLPRRAVALPATTQPDPESLLIDEQVRGQVCALQRALCVGLKLLAPRDLSILLGKYRDGARAKELAALHHLTTAQVYDRMAASKAQLRASLVDAGFERDLAVAILDRCSGYPQLGTEAWDALRRSVSAPDEERARESVTAGRRTVAGARRMPRKAPPR